jgi:sugar phosphate isomerase/epimerase
MQLEPRDLVLTQCCVAHAPFPEHVALAHQTGCRGVSVWVREWLQARELGLKPAEMRRLLGDHGLICHDVDALAIWAGEGDPGGHPWMTPEALLFEMAEALAARHLNVIFLANGDYSQTRAEDEFARVAEAAVDRGLLPYIEFIPAPLSPVSDVAGAWAIAEASGRPEAGVMIDTWHYMRGPSTLEQVRAVPGERIHVLQINDAPAQPEEDLVDETMHRRLLPGEGDINLLGLLRTLDELGSPAPVSIEVFSDELAALPPAECAWRTTTATRRVLKAARARTQRS